MSAFQSARAVTLLAITAAVLAACSSPEPADPSPEPTRPAETAAADAHPSRNPIAACELIGDGGSGSVLQRIPASLTSIGATISQQQIDELLDINETLEEAIRIAPTDLAAAVTSLKVPFQQAQDAMDASSGSLNMDTASVAQHVADVLELCVTAGYSATTADTATGPLSAAVEAALVSWPSVTSVAETEPGRIEIQTSIVDPRGTDGSAAAQEALDICRAAVGAGATYVALFEADGTHFVLFGHPAVPASACSEV